MIAAFVIWSAAAALLAAIGVHVRFSDKAAGFYANSKAPEATDVRAYNREVSRMWLIAAVLLEIIGVPFLFLKQNSPLFIPVFLLSFAWVIGLLIAYQKIERKYRKK